MFVRCWFSAIQLVYITVRAWLLLKVWWVDFYSLLFLLLEARTLRLTRCQSNSTATDPGCHCNKIWAKIGYNSAFMRDIRDSCVQQGVFGVGLLNDVSQSLPRPTLVAMATNFEPKLATTRLVWDIYLICFHLAKVFGAELLNDISQILRQNFKNLAENWL